VIRVAHVRRIPLSRRSHVTGFQPLPTGTVNHESALERDFVTVATFRDAAASIVSQPITIQFRDGPATRRYTPDFLVRWSNGRLELIEVKYWADLRANWAQLRPRFAAGRAWARERGARFRIATDTSIRGPLLENAKRLLPLRHAPLDAAIAQSAMLAAKSLVEPTFGCVVDTLPCDRAMALNVVWRLVARGLLIVDLNAPVRLDTRVTPS
jgi:TnsA endonuclease N terminal